MQVAELLHSKGSKVATVPADTTVAAIVEVLRAENIGAVVVSSDGAAIEGIVSERDIVRSLNPATELSTQTAAHIMTTEVITCAPGDRVDELMSLMTENRIRHLPVEIDGVLAGIVSIGDVVKRRVNELEFEAQALTEYIQQGR
jgi:CBS domain-containing protein